jgi:hypothetical protein
VCDGYPSTIEAVAYTLPAATTTVLSEATAIKAHTITILGRLLTRGGDAEEPAPSLCIQAEQVIVAATGIICTGSGHDGAGQAGSLGAEGGDGSDGGDLTITLKDNPLTLTTPVLTVAPGCVLCTGDGGDGGPALVEATVCDTYLPRVSRGGDAGDAGALALIYSTPTTSTLAPASLNVGKGGDGGDAYTLGGRRGSTEAYAGEAGDSLLTINGLPTTNLGTVGSGEGGDGGDAVATVALGCGGNDPCADALFTNQTYCGMRDLRNAVCKDPSPHLGTLCDAGNTIIDGLAGKDVYGPNGRDDTDAPTGPDPADPGYSGADSDAGASWQVSCGLGITAAPPFGAVGCNADAGCGKGKAAMVGFYGQPGADGASGIATATKGEFGVLMGGNGGSATATGASGGIGGNGGDGGKGAADCMQDFNGAPGARGGLGGSGGDATATAGVGGDSWVQGGKGGDASATAGSGGAGGVGGKGGAPPTGCNPYTGSCEAPPPFGGGPGLHYTSYGGYWGCGGDGGARGAPLAFSRNGGNGDPTGQDGPDGASFPGPEPTPYGAKGAHATQYLAAPSCPV